MSASFNSQGFESTDNLVEFIEIHPNTIIIFNNVTVSAHPPLEEASITPTPFPSALITFVYSMTAETCMFTLRKLSLPQLCWAFTDWSLTQLQADGWDFTGVLTLHVSRVNSVT